MLANAELVNWSEKDSRKEKKEEKEKKNVVPVKRIIFDVTEQESDQ